MHQFALTPILDIRPTVGIGDQLGYSRLPERYEAMFGRRLQVACYDQFGILATNPHVELVPQELLAEYPESVYAPWGLGPLCQWYKEPDPTTVMNPVYQTTRRLFDGCTPDLKPRLDAVPGPGQGPTVCFVTEGSTREAPNRARIVPREVLEPLVAELSRHVRVVQLGSADNYSPTGRFLNLAGKTTVIEAGSVLAAPDTAFVCVNSGLMHVANAFIPGHRIFVYMKCDVPVPLPSPRAESDLNDNWWLYEDNRFFGPEGLEGVFHHSLAAERILASLKE